VAGGPRRGAGADHRREPGRERWSGLQGCLGSILTGLGAAMLAALTGWAINGLFG
jgi:hypothetical protein